MARRTSVPERGISSEEAGLTNVNETRTKSGSLSSEEGDGFMPKQSKFFKNLSRSLDPAAAPPKKKDYLEEYQKYRAKRAFNLHGVVKQQTIDLGSLGLSGSASSDAQSRRFSTGTNPPQGQGQLVADKEAKSSTLPAVSRSSRGPPPPVAPRKKSINLPVINEPAPTQKVPSPMHDTPSYILSAVKKEQQRADVEAKKTAKPQSTVREEASEVQDDLQADEQGTPTEHGVSVSAVDDNSSVGSRVIESSLNEEALSCQSEQGVSYSNEEAGEAPQGASDTGTGEIVDKDRVTGTNDVVVKDGAVPIGEDNGVGEEETKDKGDIDQNVLQATTEQEAEVGTGPTTEAAEGSGVSESQAASDEGQIDELSSQGKDAVVLDNEKIVAEKEEANGPTEDQLQRNDELGKDENHEVENGDIENKGDEEKSEETSADLECSLTNGSENKADEKLTDNSMTEKEEESKLRPIDIPIVKIDEPETVDYSAEDGNEVTATDVCISSNAIPNGETAIVDGNAVEVGNGVEARSDVVMHEDAESSSCKEGQRVKSTESTPTSSDKETAEKLSKTADLLLSFSQEKTDTVGVEDSDLSGIGEELKKLNMTIEEMAHDKSKEREVADDVSMEVSKEDREKLQEIRAMQEEMQSMQEEFDSYL